MKQLEIDISNLNLGRNKIAKRIKRWSNKFHRRIIKHQISTGNYSALPIYNQRRSSVFNEY